MNNQEFLKTILDAFFKYLETGSRSNEKLKILHGTIAADLQNRLGADFSVFSLGFKCGKEKKLQGRYMEKKVDIAISKKGEIVGAIALKFVMSNYSQNSNNYFENMLGETANIRSSGKPYFQILILPSKCPYFDKKGAIKKIETITEHNLTKYMKLSQDDIDSYMHSPNKTLICLVDLPDFPNTVKDVGSYIDFCRKNNGFEAREDNAPYGFDKTVVFNDYNEFMNKVVHCMLAI